MTSSPWCGVRVLRVWQHALSAVTHAEEDAAVGADALDGYVEALL